MSIWTDMLKYNSQTKSFSTENYPTFQHNQIKEYSNLELVSKYTTFQTITPKLSGKINILIRNTAGIVDDELTVGSIRIIDNNGTVLYEKDMSSSNSVRDFEVMAFQRYEIQYVVGTKERVPKELNLGYDIIEKSNMILM